MAKYYGKKYKANTVKVEPVRAIREWSEYQQAIFNEVENGSGNVVINACPGSGKTTTLVEALYHIPEGLSAIFVAFNSKTALELSSRIPGKFEAKTLHALGLRTLSATFGKVIVDKTNEKTQRIITALIGNIGNEEEKFELNESLCKCVSLCKGFLAIDTNDILNVMAMFNINTFDLGEEKFCEYVKQALKTGMEQKNLIDFDDMIFLPVIHNCRFEKYDFVFVDECQDLNKAQIEIVLRSINSNGRAFFCGDIFQAIYSWRGADSNAVNNIITRTNAKTLPLSISYRCARSIVSLAQTISPDIQSYPGAPEGKVEECSATKMLEEVKPGDAIVSRINAPLVSICLNLLKEHRRANIIGRDMGKNLLWMIKKSKAENIPMFLDWLENWKQTTCEELIKKKRDCSIIEDKVECLRNFCSYENSLDDVKKAIKEIFKDTGDKSMVLLMSSHKSKGLEYDRVWVLKKTLKPGKTQEESNIAYVSYTRAKSELMLVGD